LKPRRRYRATNVLAISRQRTSTRAAATDDYAIMCTGPINSIDKIKKQNIMF
jgi:hypothetical protein